MTDTKPKFNLVKVNNIINKDLRVVQAPPRPVPDGLFKANSLINICANRGAGKTNAWINMLLTYDRETKPFDIVYLICNSVDNDPKYELLQKGDHWFKLKLYDHFDDAVFKEILKDIEGNIATSKKYEHQKKLYQKFLKAKTLKGLTPEELFELELMDFEPPECEFKHGFVQHLLIFDDMMANPYVYPNNIRGNLLTRFTILHRHKRCAIWHSVQSWKNVLHRTIRNNLTGLILFKNKSKEIQHEIAVEMANYIEPNTFVEMWDKACEGDHDFFKVDTDPTDKKYRFSKNFDSVFVLDN
jgi:hypothetical protein